MENIKISDERSILYASDQMKKVIGEVRLFAPTELSVLITGENGTGKENIARLLHLENPKRVKHPFHAINCGAISPNLIESELFGHEKGSFTGAIADKKGAFEAANGGTLFLDEIGEMSPDMQVKLLRVLETGEFRPVGSTKTQIARPRIVAATNINTERALQSGKLRPDLYHRLCGVEIHMPSLSERVSDIPLLANHFAKTYADEIKCTFHNFSDEGLAALTTYPWPGNIRELINKVRQGVLRSQPEGIITPDALNLQANASKSPVFYVGDLPYDQTFGYQLATAREARNWTQAELARHVSEQTAQAYTQTDIVEWENNRQVPDPATLNALAYLLIIRSERTTDEKKQLMEKFFAAAETAQTRGSLHGSSPTDALGNQLAALRKEAGLEQNDLIEEITELRSSVPLSQKDIYLLEHAHPQMNMTPSTVITLMNALERKAPLSAVEKLGFYERAKHVFIHADKANTGITTVHDADSMMSSLEQANTMRAKMFKLFTGATGQQIKPIEIAQRSQIDPHFFTALLGQVTTPNSTIEVRSFTDTNLAKLCGLLEKLQKQTPDIQSFIDQFIALRAIVIPGYNPSDNAKLKTDAQYSVTLAKYDYDVTTGQRGALHASPDTADMTGQLRLANTVRKTLADMVKKGGLKQWGTRSGLTEDDAREITSQRPRWEPKLDAYSDANLQRILTSNSITATRVDDFTNQFKQLRTLVGLDAETGLPLKDGPHQGKLEEDSVEKLRP